MLPPGSRGLHAAACGAVPPPGGGGMLPPGSIPPVARRRVHSPAPGIGDISRLLRLRRRNGGTFPFSLGGSFSPAPAEGAFFYST